MEPATLSPSPARADPVAKKTQSGTLTLSAAAEQWIAAKEEIARQNGLVKEAAPVLERWFKRTGRRVYKDRISYEPTGGAIILDQAKVCEMLGERLPDYQTHTKTGWTLKLLK